MTFIKKIKKTSKNKLQVKCLQVFKIFNIKLFVLINSSIKFYKNKLKRERMKLKLERQKEKEIMFEEITRNSFDNR